MFIINKNTEGLAFDKRERLYSGQWDAYYYADTGEWAEKQCNDPSCEFCSNRPSNALEAANKDKKI